MTVTLIIYSFCAGEIFIPSVQEKSQMFTLFFASDTFVRTLSTITLKTGDILRIMFYLRQIN